MLAEGERGQHVHAQGERGGDVVGEGAADEEQNEDERAPGGPRLEGDPTGGCGGEVGFHVEVGWTHQC